MSGLPRELLKWLQSLDLTYSVKNVKRDFANGFLIAEIFSRYYVQEVEMHSYDNGQSLKIKLDNWAQLNKFFKRKNIVIEKKLIDDVVHCKSLEAPTQLVATIYTQLTGREVKLHAAAVEVGELGEDPAYARPTGASLLNSQIRDSEYATTLSDQTAAASRAKQLIDDHADTLRFDRENQPSRYGVPDGTASNTQSAVLSDVLRSSGPKPVQPTEAQAAQVRFQEVRVTAVDRNIASIRASRDQALRSTSYASQPGGPLGDTDAPMALPEAVPPPPPPDGGEGRVVVADVLTRLALPQCHDAMSYLAGLQSPPDFGGVLLYISELPKQVVLEVLTAAKTEAATGLGAALKASPDNGYELFELFAPALRRAEDVEVFHAICAFLCEVGAGLSELNKAAYEVLTHYALPFLLPLLRGLQSPKKTELLLGVLYAMMPFTAAAHIDTIRALQSAVNSQERFLGLLPFLLQMETPTAAHFTSDLIALYVYYCVLALDLPKPELRAAAVAMLVTVAETNPTPVVALLPKLDALADEGWWEIAAQLGRLCGLLLRADGLDADETNAIVMLMAKVLANRQSAAQMVVLSAAAPCLASFPALLPPFVESLLELGSEARAALLSDEPLVHLAKAGGEELAFATLPATWPGVLVASHLFHTARARQLDTLEVPYTEVLSALLPHAQPEDRAEWGAFMRDHKDYMYVALCDEELCGPVTAALLPLFTLLLEESLPTFATLLSSLRMVCDNAPAHCAKVATTFLLDLYALGEPFENALRTMASNFDEPMRECFIEFVKKCEG